MKQLIDKEQDAKFLADVQEYANRRAEEMGVPPIKIARPTAGYAFASDPPRESRERRGVVY